MIPQEWLNKSGLTKDIVKKTLKSKTDGIETFTKSLEKELEMRGPIPRSIILKECLEYLGVSGDQYFVSKLLEFFLPSRYPMPTRIRSLTLAEAVKIYISPNYDRLRIEKSLIKHNERLFYLADQSLADFLNKAYKGKETVNYVNLDFTNLL